MYASTRGIPFRDTARACIPHAADSKLCQTFAQWSPETLGAGFILPFALTNSSRLPSALPTGETLPSFATWARGSESHPLIQPKNENTPVWGCSIFGGAFHFVSEPRFIFVSSIFGCVFPRNRLPSRSSV